MKLLIENDKTILEFAENLIRSEETYRIDIETKNQITGEVNNISLIRASISVIIHAKTEDLSERPLECIELNLETV